LRLWWLHLMLGHALHRGLHLLQRLTSGSNLHGVLLLARLLLPRLY
jgi:hypothetical protein